MERQFRCPSCGAANAVTNPGIVMRICDYCTTAMYWDKESVLRAGLKSVDLPPSQRFKVGATGKIKGESFRVLGRLCYAHENGAWDEWFIEMQDGKIMWLTEDEGELFLESSVALTEPAPPYGELEPGMQVKLGDRVGVIEELGEARCLGGVGEIPFQVEVGETYPYADGSTLDGASSFGLEYDTRTGHVEAYIGRILNLKDGRAAREDREAPAERLGEIIRCTACGKPYEGARVTTTAMVVCAACGTGLQLDEAEAKAVGKNSGKAPVFTLRIGLPITIEGTRYEVMGRLRYEEFEEHVPYTSFEYVLYNPDSGYLWLSEYRGHYTVGRVTHSRVDVPAGAAARTKIRVGPEVFQVYERGQVTLKWVDGALPWIAKVGEKTVYTHMVKPPEYVDQEITGPELEFFRGRYLGQDELAAGLSEKIALPRPSGVDSCQPYETPAWRAGFGKIALAFLALNLVLLFFSLAAEKKTPILQETISAQQYSKEYLTQPFTLAKDGTILRLKGSAPVDNSWLSIGFAVVDAQDRVVTESSGETAYYYGSDSEGTWTEGSRSFKSYFRIPRAGTYRLLIYGQGGSGTTGPAKNEPLQVKLTAGHTLSWYFAVSTIVCGLVALIDPLGKYLFESRRWAAVTGDGDSDD
ncbi:MAG: DUF4178 domain-containing protein [Desulfomonile tiedjei]|nr:DUF4178 domain-containing protein [Desulfomonile tiedjei]